MAEVSREHLKTVMLLFSVVIAVVRAGVGGTEKRDLYLVLTEGESTAFHSSPSDRRQVDGPSTPDMSRSESKLMINDSCNIDTSTIIVLRFALHNYEMMR